MKKSKKKLSCVIEQQKILSDFIDVRFQEIQSEVDDLRSDLGSHRQGVMAHRAACMDETLMKAFTALNLRVEKLERVPPNDNHHQFKLLNHKLRALEQQLNNAISGQFIAPKETVKPEDPFAIVEADRNESEAAYNAAMKRTAGFLEAEEKAKNALPN